MRWAKQCNLTHMGVLNRQLDSDYGQSLVGSWVHLYTDGSVKREFGDATASGVICGQSGEWILGYNHYLGFYSVS